MASLDASTVSAPTRKIIHGHRTNPPRHPPTHPPTHQPTQTHPLPRTHARASEREHARNHREAQARPPSNPPTCPPTPPARTNATHRPHIEPPWDFCRSLSDAGTCKHVRHPFQCNPGTCCKDIALASDWQQWHKTGTKYERSQKNCIDL